MTTDNTDREELKLLPCPFCGKPPETGITGAPECDNWRYVKCSNDYCPIRYSMFSVKGWNSRAAVAVPRGDAQERWFTLLAHAISTATPVDTQLDSYVISREALQGLSTAHREIAKILYGPSPVTPSLIPEQVVKDWEPRISEMVDELIAAPPTATAAETTKCEHCHEPIAKAIKGGWIHTETTLNTCRRSDNHEEVFYAAPYEPDIYDAVAELRARDGIVPTVTLVAATSGAREAAKTLNPNALLYTARQLRDDVLYQYLDQSPEPGLFEFLNWLTEQEEKANDQV